MVDAKSVHAQLRRIKFNPGAWGKAEAKELPGILSPDEKIYECVNGTYEGGFAMLVATDMRVLLIDKKPLNFLTVEDLRFDMINQIDYNHRLFGATIIINTGYKTLKFTSWNQQRLRKLITHVQDRMSEIKKEQAEQQENQKQHLAAINQQLQAYLIAQHQQLMQFQQGRPLQEAPVEFQPVKPSPELSDYLFAQSLLKQYGTAPAKVTEQKPSDIPVQQAVSAAPQPDPAAQAQPVSTSTTPAPTDDLYAEGYQEIFGKREQTQPVPSTPAASVMDLGQRLAAKNLDVNPLSIAYAKLPMMLRNRKFGRPSFHAHSQSSQQTVTPVPQA